MSVSTYRSLAVPVSSAGIRTARFNDEDHVVVSVVAMVGDSVVRPMGSTGPELVPSSVLSLLPNRWNNRPVVLDHPLEGRASANNPDILEATCFGVVFNAAYVDGRLKFEAWLSRSKAEKVGPQAVRVIERCESGELVEVSIGAYVGVDKRSGISPSGVPYEFVWTDIAASDHLAALSEGSTGACSVEMGCGAPRLNQGTTNGSETSSQKITIDKTTVLRSVTIPLSNEVHEPMSTMTTTTVTEPAEGNTEPVKRRPSLLESARQFMDKLLAASNPPSTVTSNAEDAGVSDVELRDSLWSALYSVEPALGWIHRIYPESNTVIYVSMPENETFWYRRSYTVADDNSVALADDRERVELVESYEVVAAATQPATTSSPVISNSSCSCGGHSTTAQTQGGSMSDTKKNLVGRLIANSRSPFTDKDAPGLSALSEEALQNLDETYKTDEPKKEEAKVETPAAQTAPAQTQTETPVMTEAMLRQHFPDVWAAAEAHKAEQLAKKETLVATLKSNQTEYSETDLRAMSVPDLSKLSKLLKLDAPTYDFTGARVQVSLTNNAADSVYDPPDTWGLNKATKSDTDRGAN